MKSSVEKDTIVNALIAHNRLTKYRKDRKILAMRECASNAANYEADSMEFIVIESTNGDTYLLCGHNGEPFSSTKEMVDKGLAAYKTGEKGSSLNGVGLHASALSLAGRHWNRYVKQVIMSEIDGKWNLVMGKAETEERRCWLKLGPNHPESIALLSSFKERTFNSKKNSHPFFDRNRVAYAFALDKPSARGINSANDDIRVDLVNTLIQSDPALFSKISVRFFDGTIKENESFGDKQENTAGGSSYRYAADPQEFDDRYKDDHEWEPIVITDLEVDINGDRVIVGKAKVVVRTYSGSRATPSWLSSVRDGETRNGRVNKDARGGTFSRGSGSGPGKIPHKAVFLSLPAINSKEKKSCYNRFNEGAVWMDSIQAHSQDLFGLSLNNNDTYPDIDKPEGLPARPFVLVNIYIEDISLIEFKDGELEKNPSAICLLGLFGEEPDFTADSGICRQFSKAIMNEARKFIPTELIALLNQRCPQPELELLDLWGKGGGQSENRPPKFPCKIYDLSGENISVLDKDLHLGDKKYIAIYDTKRNGFISENISWKPGITRGILELTRLTNTRFLSPKEQSNLAELSEQKGINIARIVPFLLEIPPQVFKETEGMQDITESLDKDYIHGAACMPTRNLVATSSVKPTITVGQIVEIPKNSKNKNTRNHTTKDAGHSGSIPNGTGSQKNEYTTRLPQVIGEWKSSGGHASQGGVFALNSNNTQVHDFFLAKNTTPALEQDLREFYFLINATVQSLYYSDSAIHIEASLSEELLLDENGKEIYNEHWADYSSNKLAETILNSEIGQKILDRVKKHRETHQEKSIAEIEQTI